MTTLLAESTGSLSISVDRTGRRIEELAFRSAAEIVESGESLIVVDAANCFEPSRLSHSARIGAMDPAGLLKHLHVLCARSAAELEDLVLHQLEVACERFGTRHVLVPDILGRLYDPTISTRDAARILGRVKTKLEGLVINGYQIVVLCRQDEADLGTRSHFLSSLCASADRVYFRNNT